MGERRRKKGEVSPSTEVEIEKDEAEYLTKVMGDELKITGKAVEIAEEEIKEVLENVLVRDIEELIERGWFWFTVIPSKKEGEE